MHIVNLILKKGPPCKGGLLRKSLPLEGKGDRLRWMRCFKPRISQPAAFVYHSFFITLVKNSTAFTMFSSFIRSFAPWMLPRSSLVSAMAEKR